MRRQGLEGGYFMKHLTHGELVDLVDGVLPEQRVVHLGACARCRQQADELRAVMREAREVVVPEPSPLFWDHLSARVREDVAAELATGSPNWWPGWSPSRLALALTAAAAILVGAVSGVMFRSPTEEVRLGVDRLAALQELGLSSADAKPELFESWGDEPGWALVVTVAQGIEWWDELGAAGLLISSSAAERAVLQLSTEGRRELARLLQAELEGGGSEP